MNNTPENRSERVFAFIEKFEELFITVSGIIIGLSPILVFLHA